MSEKYINDFNGKATEWDKNPMHLDRSEAFQMSVKHICNSVVNLSMYKT
jgi:hypothetical protein